MGKRTQNILTIKGGKLTTVKVKGTCSVEWAKNYDKSANVLFDSNMLAEMCHKQAQPQDTEKLLNADLTINGIYQILGQFGEEHEPIKKKFREYCEKLTKKQK